jgi:paraquat-inducible protein A
MDRDTLIACHECDALLHKRLINAHETARCPRCGALLYRGGRAGRRLDPVCALVLGSLITFVIAQGFPILDMDVNGNHVETTLFSALVTMWRQDMPVISILVFICTLLFPLVELCALLYVLLPLRHGRVPPGCSYVLRGIDWVRPWGMIEVFMLGILVTIVKMTSLAQVTPEAALFAFAALTLMIATVVSLDTRMIWQYVDAAHSHDAHHPPAVTEVP